MSRKTFSFLRWNEITFQVVYYKRLPDREILNKAASFIELNRYKTIQLTQTDRGKTVPRVFPQTAVS